MLFKSNFSLLFIVLYYCTFIKYIFSDILCDNEEKNSLNRIHINH